MKKSYHATLKKFNLLTFLWSFHAPIIHGPNVQVPSSELPVISPESSDSEVQGFNTGYKPSGSDSSQYFSTLELNDLTRDLVLSNKAVALLDSRLKEENIG